MRKRNLIHSFRDALCGIVYGFCKERNMKVHYFIMLMVVIMGFVFRISFMEWYICIILFGLVLSLEYVNTAIEKTVDICSPTYTELARIAKDTAAGAVLICAIISIIVGGMIFLPKFLLLI